MKELSRWLVNIENEARLFYEKAAEIFSEDKDLELLLTQLAKDELQHYALVSKAFELAELHDETASPLIIDAGTKRKIEDLLNTAKDKLASGTMTKAELMDAIVQIEFTETNEIFLYVVSALKNTVKNIYNSASNITAHKSRISEFVRARTEFSNILPDLDRIPDMNKELVLTIEDDETMIEAFDIFLSDTSVVENASSATEALKKIDRQDYSAIIVDIKSNFINGRDIYKSAVEKRPELADKFLFLVDNECSYIDFFDRLNIKYLEKPVSLKDVKRSVSEMI